MHGSVKFAITNEIISRARAVTAASGVGGHIECAARGRPLLHRRRGGHSREPDRRVGGGRGGGVRGGGHSGEESG